MVDLFMTFIFFFHYFYFYFVRVRVGVSACVSVCVHLWYVCASGVEEGLQVSKMIIFS